MPQEHGSPCVEEPGTGPLHHTQPAMQPWALGRRQLAKAGGLISGGSPHLSGPAGPWAAPESSSGSGGTSASPFGNRLARSS
jgi:hypothetical protein